MPGEPIPHHPGACAEYIMGGTVNLIRIPENVPTGLARRLWNASVPAQCS
jgi:hypothetical protein